jgi:protocatechuate 3,4-dioxygenase beta subunit
MAARRSVLVLVAAVSVVSGWATGSPSSATGLTATHSTAADFTLAGSSSTGTLPTPARASTPPGPVTKLTLTGNNAHSISLGWTNPTDAAFAGVLIRRAAGDTPPITASDGTLVATLGSRQTAFTDKRLGVSSTYSYAVFSRDQRHNVGVAATLTTATRSTSTSTGLRGELADQQGRAVARARVEVREAASGHAVAVTATAATGQFSVTNLTPGSYLLCFQPDTEGVPHSTGYLPGCHRSQPYGYGTTGTPVTVMAGQLTSGLLDQPPAGGALAGRVTDSAGSGLPNVLVQAFDPSTPEYGPYVALTDQDGTYTVAGLAAGSYQVCFHSEPESGASPTGYLDECYDDQPPHTGSETQVPVELGQTSAGVNAALAVAGAVTGVVSDPAGAPVSDIEVRMYRASLGAGTGRTDGNGAYIVKGLPTGSYTLCLDGSYTVQATAPYGYTNDCVGEPGVTVDVVAGQATTSNGTIERAGAVSGVVTGNGPVAGVWVSVYASSGSYLNSTSTDDNGSYQLNGLAPGEVTVCFDPTYTAGGYQRTCYGAEADGSGSPVPVTAGRMSTADVRLQLGASITGTVTDASGTRVSGVLVSAFGMSSGTGYYSETDESGSYTFSGVTAENYQLCFDPSYAAGPPVGGYAAQCYHDQLSAGTANPVTVGASGAVTVDAVLRPGAVITGQVTDSAGRGIPNAYVETYDAGGAYLYPFGVTDEQGSYRLTGVPATAVVVCFQATDGGVNGTGYLSECYDDQADVSSADVVNTTAGAVSSGVDAELADAP